MDLSFENELLRALSNWRIISKSCTLPPRGERDNLGDNAKRVVVFPDTWTNFSLIYRIF